jgi:hypothetical protein
MKRFAKIGVLMTVAIALFGAYRHVSAQGEQATRFRTRAVPPTFVLQPSELPPPATKHVLVGTYVNQWTGTSLTLTADAFTPIDPVTTITCPGTTGSCLIVSEQWTEVLGGSSCSGAGCNGVATCLYVDGVPDSNCDKFDGDLQASSLDLTAFQTTTSHQATVTHGTHTVQTIVNAENGGFTDYWQYQYKVYKP